MKEYLNSNLCLEIFEPKGVRTAYKERKSSEMRKCILPS